MVFPRTALLKFLLFAVVIWPFASWGEAVDDVPEVTAESLVAGALDLVRGRTSYTELSMIIHRPDWERTSSLVSWTRGREEALMRFTAPARDAGNATLKQGDKMWTYTPKLNRTIRLPYSLMSQSWAAVSYTHLRAHET